MDSSMKMRLRGEAQKIKPTLRVGKNGVTASLIEEIRSQLKNKRMMKIQVLRSHFMERTMEDIAFDIANSINGVHIIDLRGHTLVLYK